jgi:hypothetical protein
LLSSVLWRYVLDLAAAWNQGELAIRTPSFSSVLWNAARFVFVQVQITSASPHSVSLCCVFLLKAGALIRRL